jgi:hypothetical protein
VESASERLVMLTPWPSAWKLGELGAIAERRRTPNDPHGPLASATPLPCPLRRGHGAELYPRFVPSVTRRSFPRLNGQGVLRISSRPDLGQEPPWSRWPRKASRAFARYAVHAASRESHSPVPPSGGRPGSNANPVIRILSWRAKFCKCQTSQRNRFFYRTRARTRSSCRTRLSSSSFAGGRR